MPHRTRKALRRPAASAASAGIRAGFWHRHWPALLVFGAALLVRVIYVLQARANPQFDAPLMDPGYHDEWASQLAAGTWRPAGPFFRAPLYPLFLAAIYALAGHDYLVPRLVQAVLGSASCVMLYAIGRRLFSRITGLLAGLIAALYWILIYHDNELLIEPLFVFLMLAFFHTLLSALDAPPRPARWALAGLCFGLAAIARPTILIFAPALAWLFWRRRRQGRPVAAVLAFVIVALIPMGAVTLYNVVAGDDLVFIASQGGVNFYIGNNPQSDGHTAIVPGTRGDWWGGRFDTIKIAERAAGRPLKESEVSSYWFRQGLDFAIRQPGAWLKLTARKLGLFWMAHEIGNNDCIPHLRSFAPIMKLPFFGFGLIAPLGLAGIFLAWRRRREATLLPLAFLGLYMLGVVAFFVCARYRVPALPFLILFAAAAITLGREMWRAGARRDVRIAAGIFAVAVLAMNLPARSYKENFALARFHDSVAWKKKGNLTASEQALREALRLDPGLAEARTNLANLLSERGDAHAAGAAYEEAALADPRNAKAWANLASHRLQGGDLAAAEEALRRALAVDPDHSEALRILGVIREQQGNFAAAREAYEHALRFTREPQRLENNLGVLCMREGDTAAAEEHLRRAVALDPSYAMAWSNLAALLGRTDRLSEAVEPLRRAAELQPGSPQAWTQLAEVLRALGRAEEAEQALRRAHPGSR